MCCCQNNIGITRMTSCDIPSWQWRSNRLSFLWVCSRAIWSCDTWFPGCYEPAKTIIIQCGPFHALLGAFVVIIFVQCTVASAPTPSAALPCSGLRNAETDLNTVGTVIVPLNTVQCLHCHSRPLSDILSQCLLSSESPGWPVQLWQSFPVWSSVCLFPFAGMMNRGDPHRVTQAQTWYNAIQCVAVAVTKINCFLKKKKAYANFWKKGTTYFSFFKWNV